MLRILRSSIIQHFRYESSARVYPCLSNCDKVFIPKLKQNFSIGTDFFSRRTLNNGDAAQRQIKSFYKRQLPTPPCIAFSSTEGKAIFRQAWDQGYMEAYFPLIEQFQTQEAPTFCGLSTVTMVLNTLNIDPGRTWQMPWRWYHETMLDCCEPDQIVRQHGTTFSQIACLARCNGAYAEMVYASKSSVEEFREKVKKVCSNTGSPRQYIIVSYDRSVLKQTGCGHFSPIGGYDPEKDLVLILDVARFKYPPHWVKLPLLFDAMVKEDAKTHSSRGFIIMQRHQIQGRFFTISNTDQHRWCEIVSWFQTALAAMHGDSPRRHPVGHHSHTNSHSYCQPFCVRSDLRQPGNPIDAISAVPVLRASKCQISGPTEFIQKLISDIPSEVNEMITTHTCTFNDQWTLSCSKQSIETLIKSVEETSMFKTVLNEINSQSSLETNPDIPNRLKDQCIIASIPDSQFEVQLARKEHFLTVWMLACGMSLIKRLPASFDLSRLSEDFNLTGISSLLKNEITHVSRQIDALLEENICQYCPEAILHDQNKNY